VRFRGFRYLPCTCGPGLNRSAPGLGVVHTISDLRYPGALAWTTGSRKKYCRSSADGSVRDRVFICGSSCGSGLPHGSGFVRWVWLFL
jgi:hypothetical protein